MERTVGIVAINETEFLSDELKEKTGGAQYTLYFYDPSEETHLAEITPSYYLVPFDYYTKEFLSDEDDSEYRTDILGDEIYMHCRTVDAIKDQFKATTVIELDDDEDFVEQAREALQANPEQPPHALTL
jgi:hypothetical protein